ncbi:MAG: hypothetical protein JRN59_06200 [Nitrososphaerota archaeon]|nr:hypothetical protein [Nitrososphaerota archaeon]
MTTFDLVVAMALGVAAVSVVMTVDARRSKKRKEADEEYWRRRHREQDEEKKRKEAEEKRWKELEAKYGVGRDEVEYQTSRGLRLWNEWEGEQKPTPGHVGFVGVVRKNTGEKASTEPYRVEEVRFKWIKEVEQIESKENTNVFAAGASGAGKSSLVRLLLRKFEGKRRIVVFSFKAGDTHLRIGYPVADVAELAPNPFTDAEAMVSAFAIAYPVSAIGVTASQIPSLVRELACDCASWKDFDRNLERRIDETKDRVQLSALFFVREQTMSLKPPEADPKKADLINQALENGLDLVLDFSGLADSAKAFYAELLLRAIWNSLKKRTTEETEEKTIVYVDEAHRLTRGTFEKYHSILREMAREIRERGALWTSTQNFTDIEDDVRNQFASQYVFYTSSQADLEALRTIDPMLAWTASQLPKHRFVDAKSKFVHEEVDVYTFGLDGEADASPPPLAQALEGLPSARKDAMAMDYNREVRDALSSEGVVWVSDLSGRLGQRYDVDKGEAKLDVRRELEKLVRAGEVEKTWFILPNGNRAILHYLGGDPTNESGLHRWMVARAAKQQEQAGLKVLHVAKSGEDAPDVETEAEYIECETGKKRRTDDLEARMTRLTGKPFLVLVPNEDVRTGYLKLRNHRARVEVIE